MSVNQIISLSLKGCLQHIVQDYLDLQRTGLLRQVLVTPSWIFEHGALGHTWLNLDLDRIFDFVERFLIWLEYLFPVINFLERAVVKLID